MLKQLQFLMAYKIIIIFEIYRLKEYVYFLQTRLFLQLFTDHFLDCLRVVFLCQL